MVTRWSTIFIVNGQLRLTGGRKLQSPKGIDTRPTSAMVREAVMNILGIRVDGCNWLDLCSGSGAMGCEALQKGARQVLAVEQNKKTAKICKTNLMTIASGENRVNCVEVFCHEVISFLTKGYQEFNKSNGQDNRFDLVYFDPPYKSTIYFSVLEKLLEGNWIKQDSLVICEHSSLIRLKAPEFWIEQDRRVYGSSSLLLLTPP